MVCLSRGLSVYLCLLVSYSLLFPCVFHHSVVFEIFFFVNFSLNLFLVQLVQSDTFLKPLLKDNEQCDFCMCNPPFFSDESETTGNQSRSGTRPRPSSVCTGTVTETVTTGGEVEFVGGVIEDSLELKTRIK